MRITAAIESATFGLSGDIGGLKYQTYWTPSGDMRRAVPSMRDFVRKNAKGEIIEQGTRDANLDKGWLLTKPEILKIHCLFCDKWHDTQDEVDACQEIELPKKIEFDRKITAQAREEMAEEAKNQTIVISKLEAKVAELTKLVEGFLAHSR